MFRFNRASSVLAASAMAFGLFMVAGCQPSTPPEAQKSLYERLGGEAAITDVVDKFVAKAAADPAVNFTRVGHTNHWDATPDNVVKLKKSLVIFIGMATGGPQKYEGDSMKKVHEGMGITEAEWKAIVGDLISALNDDKVPQKEQDELIHAVAGTHDDIVGH